MSAIFPIIRSSRINQIEEICGTGFLISSKGHFFTCSHVIGPGTRVTYSAGIDPSNLRIRASIELTYRSSKKDIFFGKLSSYRGTPLSLVARAPKLGSLLRVDGYAGALIRSLNGVSIINSVQGPNEIEATCIEIVHKCKIPQETYDNTTFPSRKFSALISSGSVPDGYSGGPVLDATGKVVALHSAAGKHPTLNDGNPFMVHVSARELRFVLRTRSLFASFASPPRPLR
jgi:hypothetical protein